MSSNKMKLSYYIYILAAVAVAEKQNVTTLLHDGNNKLSARMFTEVAKENPDKSFVMSAFSVMTPLAQLGLASEGDAHDELLEAIGMPDDVTTKEVFSVTNNRLRSVKGITLKTASKIYITQDYSLNEEFANDTRDIFESEVQNINVLDSENAAKEVNTWVEEQTNNNIKNIVDQNMFTSDTKVLLVNAIYFKGLWEVPFKKSLTRDYQFHINSNKTTTVSMMRVNGRYRYAKSLDLKSQIIEIPYEGGESSLVIVLPKDIEGIKEVESFFEDPGVLDKALTELNSRKIELNIPRFKIETTIDLRKLFIQINIKKTFNANTAKLYNLVKDTRDLYIDSAQQKAFIEVNEEGTEAAAANVFRGVVRSKPRVVMADHPFLFFLREGDNILFSGVYYAD